MVKIFLDPGHGGSDPGARGNGLAEKTITLKIAQIIRNILTEEYENVQVLMSRNGDETVSLASRTDAANRWGANLYLSIHVNAGGGTGFESFVFPNVPARTKNVQRNIHYEVVNAANWRDRGMKTANFHVLRESAMDAVLTENGFIDYLPDAEKLKDGAFLEKIARGHVNGIAKFFNLKKKAGSGTPPLPQEPGNLPGSLYKVQIGAFRNRENAEALAERARKAGFDVYIEKTN
jgi:N-acetylmuramoyl-L-alanine amidase./Sporulation related domain.